MVFHSLKAIMFGLIASALELRHQIKPNYTALRWLGRKKTHIQIKIRDTLKWKSSSTERGINKARNLMDDSNYQALIIIINGK